MANLRKPDVVTVAVSRVDGGLTVLRVIENEYVPFDGVKTLWRHYDITPQYIEHIIARHNWTGNLAMVSWRIVPNDFVDDNTDRTYREAWKDTPGKNKPDHDMAKAREVHKNYMRRARTVQLEALDTEYLLADENGDTQKKRDVAAKKQFLRDVTASPAIEAASTPEELKAIWFVELGAKPPQIKE